MSLFLKQFNTHAEYDTYINSSDAILPNVSICTTELHVHYNPFKCEETSTYELVGTPSYPSEVDGASASFDMTFNYKRTDINEECKETITEGSDTVTVDIGTNPSTTSSRTVEGTYDYHGLEIAYTITQTKYEVKATAKLNVTDTSSPTRLCNSGAVSQFSAIEIDGVAQPSVVSSYTFSTTGEHTVKYTLTSPTSIGQNAFRNCISLTSIDIPDSVTSIGSYAFGVCSSLTSCTIGSSVTSIGESAFFSATSLTSIDIPSGVTSIGRDAFYECRSLTSINLPDGVTSIGNSAFFDCSSLTSIDIPNSVTSIGNSAFWNCTSLTSVTIPSGVTSIGQSAFQQCIGLTSVTIPSGVTSIGSQVFYSCRSLTSVTIPSGVTSIGQSAFGSCSSLTSMTVDNNNTVYDSRNNCNGIINTSTNTLIAGCKNTVIPNSVTSIGNGAFYHCSGLTSIVIPDSVTSISNRAFYYCTSLTSIVSNAITAPTIQSNTFQYVKTGGTLTVPQGSSGYDVWMGTGDYYLGKYNWTKAER